MCGAKVSMRFAPGNRRFMLSSLSTVFRTME